MNEFLLFLKEHWRILAEIAVALIVILVTIFKKKVKFIDVVKEVILEVLPSAINKVEQKFGSGHGTEKLVYVCELVQTYICQKYGLSEEVVVRLYHSFIRENVEDILSTPTKKER